MTNSSTRRKRGRGRSGDSQKLIDWSVQWFAENHPATIRAVCYQLFVAGYISSMERKETARVSRLLTEARKEGLLPWHHVTDETREAERAACWDNPEQLIDAAVGQYRRDNWQGQPNRVEVWSEKGTIRGTIEPVLREYGVTFRVMHGFSSTTALHSVATETADHERPLTVLYLGDYDPSGMYMSEVDIPKRFAEYGGWFDFHRIALTYDDVEPGTSLPHFDADTKKKDRRYQWFAERYGRKCWELDAMPPGVLRKRVNNAIRGLLDLDAWDHALKIETAETENMRSFLAVWKSISRPVSEYSEGA